MTTALLTTALLTTALLTTALLTTALLTTAARLTLLDPIDSNAAEDIISKYMNRYSGIDI